MPQHIQPLSLRDLSVAKVAQMTFRSCVTIEETYGCFDWSASQRKELDDLQSFLLSIIWPLWEEVWQVIYEKYIMRTGHRDKRKDKLYPCGHFLQNFRIVTALLIHGQMRKLELPLLPYCSSLGRECVSEDQISKLKSIVKLDIRDLKLTNEMLETIGHNSKDLKEICITLCSNEVKLESLCYLFKCRELQCVEVNFNGWENKQYEPYVLKFITELPKLKLFVSLNGITEVLQKLPSATSLQCIHLKVNDSVQLKTIIERCPHVHHLNLTIILPSTLQSEKVQTVLAESSLQLNTFDFTKFTFGKSLDCLLERKGGNLTKLVLNKCVGRDTTISDIYAIGINCPKLEELTLAENVFEFNSGFMHAHLPVLTPETSIITAPCIFRKLRSLHMTAKRGWDVRLLLQVLFHANSLKTMSVQNVYPYGFQDVLAEILDVNPLTELEVLSFSAHHRKDVTPLISEYSIERFVASCPKLHHLNLSLLMEGDAHYYLKELFIRMKTENLNLEVTCDYHKYPSGKFGYLL